MTLIRLTSLFAITLAAIITLSACEKKQSAPLEMADNSSGHAIFYKDGVSDHQQIRDLNKCANEAFQSSMDNNTVTGDPDGSKARLKCMRAKGYEAFYN